MLGFLRFAREGLTSIDLIDLIDNTKEQSEDEMWQQGRGPEAEPTGGGKSATFLLPALRVSQREADWSSSRCAR